MTMAVAPEPPRQATVGAAIAGGDGDGLTPALASTGVGLAGEVAGDWAAGAVTPALGDTAGALADVEVQAATSTSAQAARTRMHA